MTYQQLFIKKYKTVSICAFAACLISVLTSCKQKKGTSDPADTSAIPYLEQRGLAKQLIVDGKPFLVLGGELHNSSATSAAYLKPLLPRLDTMHLNTVLAAVTWELMEPQEGKYNFALVDSVLDGARKNHLKVALLWFGTWKNGLSHYVPEWMKTNYKRFPRMHIKGGFPVEAISPFCTEAMQADAKAFAALMKHVKEADAQHTVILIQVENEVGLIGDSRDRGPLAEKAYQQQVPAELISYLQKNKAQLLPETQKLWAAKGSLTKGTWAEVFGTEPQGEEAFMAWQYARYLNTVAAAGKAEYALPMFVNTWIVQPDDRGPGDYPSGGPQAHSHDIWKAAAPAIDLRSPDVYLDNFEDIAALYSRNHNSLFIPESKADNFGAANAFLLIGKYNAIGYSPFGIDNRVKDAVKGPIPLAYATLQQLAPEILDAQSKGTITGVSLSKTKPEQIVELGGYKLDIKIKTNRNGTETHEVGYAIAISKGNNEFIVAGADIQVNFYPTTPGPAYVGYAVLDEGKYVDGKWVAGRRLNGDDIMLNYHLADEAAAKRVGSVVRTLGDEPQIIKLKLYRFE
jgi:hypothetical protein